METSCQNRWRFAVMSSPINVSMIVVATSLISSLPALFLVERSSESWTHTDQWESSILVTCHTLTNQRAATKLYSAAVTLPELCEEGRSHEGSPSSWQLCETRLVGGWLASAALHPLSFYPETETLAHLVVLNSKIDYGGPLSLRLISKTFIWWNILDWYDAWNTLMPGYFLKTCENNCVSKI